MYYSRGDSVTVHGKWLREIHARFTANKNILYWFLTHLSMYDTFINAMFAIERQ
jgi:uncharacterized membrane protein